jgi:hypothetical protein
LYSLDDAYIDDDMYRIDFPTPVAIRNGWPVIIGAIQEIESRCSFREGGCVFIASEITIFASCARISSIALSYRLDNVHGLLQIV